MKYILSLIISGALVVSGFGQTRNVLVNTNNAVVQPTNFWSADASNARSGLGLGSAATNASSAFQGSSLVLSNLASSNGVNLTNIPLSGVVGALATNGNGAGLTNLTAANITGTVGLASNVTGTIAISNGGTGATNAGGARTNLGLGWNGLTNTNASDFRNALELGSINSVSFTRITVDPSVDASAIRFGTNITGFWSGPNTNYSSFSVRAGGNNLVLFETNRVLFFTNIVFDGGSSGSVAGATRTNLGLGATNVVEFNEIVIGNGRINYGGGSPNGLRLFDGTNEGIRIIGDTAVGRFSGSLSGLINLGTGSSITFGANSQGIIFNDTNARNITRTNLGLGLPALTNTNNSDFLAAFFGANTNPVLVNTNGEVVSPTNFWQVAPISTTVQYQTNVTETSTNAATNSRNLFLFSLAPSVSGVTNTVTLPTNPATTFEGDRATITHLAQTTNAVTAIRQLGAATNLITLNQLDEAVLLMYRGGAWILADNISYIEPIYFSGTNAAANAASSRTNLGLGATWLTNTNAATFRTDIGLGWSALTNSNAATALLGYNKTNGRVVYSEENMLTFTNNISIFEDVEAVELIRDAASEFLYGITMGSALSFFGTNTELSASTTRTNLGLGATNSVSFSNVTASGTLTATGTVTATTNLVVNGFVDFSTNHTNSNPATNNQINDFIEIRVGTNQFWLPVYK
jgi:hypothetical protein